MTFTLKSLGGRYESLACYFILHSGDASFFSPVYPDRPAAIKGMEILVLNLRDRMTTNINIVKRADRYELHLFGKDELASDQSTTFAERSEARSLLNELNQAAQAINFSIQFQEVKESIAEVQVLADLDQLTEDQSYTWIEVGKGTLRVEKTKQSAASGFLKPSMGLSPSVSSGPCGPLFNVLQPQVSGDLPLFMGRKQEVEDLYALTRNNRLLLLYGKPQVGKTSLIQCGLANRIEAVPGQVIVHQRTEEGILPSLSGTLRKEIEELSEAAAPETDDPTALLSHLHEKLSRPIFLVFDQLEDLFEPLVSEAERKAFFHFVETLTHEDSLPCRVILSIREAFLAPLADYEELLPSLLTHRYRVQSLDKASMMDVSTGLMDLFQLKDKMRVENPQEVAEKMCAELADEDGNVPFQCLQIYMQQLHQKSCAQSGGETPVFNSGLVDQMGSAHNLIDEYISQRVEELKAQLPSDGSPADPTIHRELKNLEESRASCGCGGKKAVVPVAAAAAGVGVGQNKVRNLRWVLLLALLGLLFSIFGAWWIYNWLQRSDACFMAQQLDTCEAYINYLSEEGDQARCAAEFRTILEERGCQVWSDYQLIQKTRSCGTYQTFYQKYRNSAVNTDFVQKKLVEWECPLVRDTVELTVRDTVFNRTPASFDRLGNRITLNNGGGNPSCQEFDGTNFKKVGPLWIMTDPLPGGPYVWEDALKACQDAGLRLPCIGEVEFLLSSIYLDRADRAYQMLTGSGECYLINPTKAPNQRIDFWTATEANDAYAWSFYFDTSTKTIGRESNISKTKGLPCLCVKKDTNAGVTGLPPCYQKNIDRSLD